MSEFRDPDFIGDPQADHLADEAELRALGLQAKARASIDTVLGKVETVIEKTAGTTAARKVRVKADQVVERAETLVSDARSRVDMEVSVRPYRTLAIVAGAGILLGLLMARRERTIIYRAA